ncbi:glycosyltransferase [uncultured Tateyamaria sp.]|uniref:glycosyltransferase family 2 protein n=1 Tax=uncultured Tateyamaria sp. TaxID=455651 RepID=UPI00260D35BC|nr:glycosyltransferase [uncultured Tateyamaria sp.]
MRTLGAGGPEGRVTSPLISLVVPVYNVADHVGACIASLKAQTLTDFEVIVVDDGSTDDSAVRLRAAIDGDPRFVVLRQTNGGLSAARNTGLERARAPVIGFVDSDDRVDPNYLSAMYEVLEQTGADWVSCGILFCAPDTDPVPHTGVHDAGTLEGTAPPERHDLTRWTEVVRHFPSAWNKLYRASLIDGLRFDEGMLYEDHAFYWQAAARTDHLVRLNRPLYLQTQGRAGQITGDASDAVFQQFDVLDRLAGLAEGLDRADVPLALCRIATRLSFERVVPLRDRARRARFVARAQVWMAERGMVPDRTLSVPVWWGDVLTGAVPVSVVVPSDGALAPLAETLSSLANQTLAEAEILVVPDGARVDGQGRADLYAAAAVHPGVSILAGARGVHGARNRGLDAAQGRYVVFLDAGDRLPPRALAQWAGRLGAAEASVGFAPMRMGPDETWHPGLHDRNGIAPDRLEDETGFVPTPEDGIEMHGHPSSKMFARALLDRHGLRFVAGPLSSTLFLLAALAQADRAAYLRAFPPFIATRPDCRTLWRAPEEAETLWQALLGLNTVPALPRIPPAQQARLWARMVWEKINYADFPDPEARTRFEEEVRALSPKLEGLGQARLDPFIGPRVRAQLGLPKG